MNCLNCNIELTSDRAKTCSPRCRVAWSRKQSVTAGESVTLKKPESVTEEVFEYFTVTVGRDTEAGKVAGEKFPVKVARYWYDVPLGAIPVVNKDWPPMPDYMNGRQYFLWWKNNFEEAPTGPVLHNPFKQYDSVTYKPYRSGMGV